MARLALASGPAIARGGSRRPARRTVRRRNSSAGLRVGAGYALCLAIAVAALLFGSLDVVSEAPSEPWAAPAPSNAPWTPSEPASAPDRPAAPAGASVRVVDGDTLDLAGERVRLLNIDAPEMPPRSKCASEAEGALAATARLNALVRSGSVTLEREGEDRYGRTLARVYVDGADAGDALIAAGLVRPWEGRRRSWCA